jgi:DNA-binding XRE family transcriptional regulator
MVKSGFKTGYPAFPVTIGEHIRKRRMDLGLFQKEVAEIVGTSIECITFWENVRSQPQIHFYPKIISFLGNYPFNEVDTFSGKLLKYRHLKGLHI